MKAWIESLHAYPLKGLSAQSALSVELEPDSGFPGDRLYALARPDGAYRDRVGSGVPKSEFFTLATHERLAGLESRYEADSCRLSVFVQSHKVLSVDLSDFRGRGDLVEFFARVLDLRDGKQPVLARDAGRSFTDAAVLSDRMMNAVSIVNAATVRDLARRIGSPVDPRRFRANVYVDGIPAHSELALVGNDITIGCARLRVARAISRCAVTEVNPSTARRDLPIPKLMKQEYGHVDLGVLAQVVDGGRIEAGMAMERVDERGGRN